MTSTTIVAEQSAQPTFADVRVGIMRIGARDGRVVAQLALRSPRNQEIIIVDVGDVVDLHGAGMMHVDALTPGDGTDRGTATLTFEPTAEA